MAEHIETIAQVEQRHIMATLTLLNWNKSETARALGITRATLHRKLKEYGESRPPQVESVSAEVRRGLACLVAYREELLTRDEACDWSGSPLAAGGDGRDAMATSSGTAIDRHFGHVASSIMYRSHE